MMNGDSAARESQVTEQIKYLDKANAELEATIGVLEGRLERVLRPSSPEKDAESEKEPGLVSLASDMRVQVYHINSCRYMLSSILERLEL
jgi:hypothetical protein